MNTILENIKTLIDDNFNVATFSDKPRVYISGQEGRDYLHDFIEVSSETNLDVSPIGWIERVDEEFLVFLYLGVISRATTSTLKPLGKNTSEQRYVALYKHLFKIFHQHETSLISGEVTELTGKLLQKSRNIYSDHLTLGVIGIPIRIYSQQYS